MTRDYRAAYQELVGSLVELHNNEVARDNKAKATLLEMKEKGLPEDDPTAEFVLGSIGRGVNYSRSLQATLMTATADAGLPLDPTQFTRDSD